MDIAFDQATGLYRHRHLAVSTGLTDELLAVSYLKMKEQRLIETFYFQGTPTLTEYLRRTTDPSCICLGAFVDRTGNAKDAQFVGFSCVFDREEMIPGVAKAETSFCFFRHCCSPSEKVALGKMMVEALFGTFNISVLVGSTPSPNKLALRYSHQVGFEISGEIKNFCMWEGALTGIHASTLTRRDWQARQKRESESSQSHIEQLEQQALRAVA